MYRRTVYKIIQNQRQKNNKNEVIPESTIAGLLKQICQGVRYLHTLRIIHRDMKPQNILLERGLVKICDFGWAVVQNNNLRSTFCGTPLYVSPEVLKGNKYDDKIDLWAIGIMAWEMKFGQIPFKQIANNTYQDCKKFKTNQVTEDIVFPTQVHYTQEFKDFIEKILQKNPKQILRIGSLLEHPFLNV